MEVSEFESDLLIRQWVNDREFAQTLTNPNFEKQKSNPQNFVENGKLADVLRLLEFL